MTSDAESVPLPQRRWKILLVVSGAVALIALLLILHAYGGITLGLLASQGEGDFKQHPLLVARGRAFADLDAALERRDYVEAGRVVERLRATADELQVQLRGSIPPQQLSTLKDGLRALRAQIEAQRAMDLGAFRLAYESLWPHATTPRYSPAVRERILAQLEEAKQGAERFEPVVPGLSFVRIPLGNYWIGTPPEEPGRREEADKDGGWLPDLPVQQVTIKQAYWISTTEVPREVYTRVRRVAKAQWDGRERVEGRRLPASHIPYEDARLFCRDLSTSSKTYYFDLPSETEWEIACRARERPEVGPFVVDEGQQAVFDGARSAEAFRTREDRILLALRNYAVFLNNSRALLGDYGLRDLPAPIELGAPNRLGLYDVHGGVAEWCRPAEAGSELRVVRGGHAISGFADLRAGARMAADPKQPSLYGIRLIARERTSAP